MNRDCFKESSLSYNFQKRTPHPISRILYNVLFLMPEVVERHIERLIPETVHRHLEPHGADVSSRVVEAGDDEVTKPDIDRGLQSLEVL